MVTPVGRDLETTWAALVEGKSGVGPISLFDASTFPTRIAAEVKDFSLGNYRSDAARWSEHSRNSKFALAAAQMAVDDSGLLLGECELDRTRFGVYLGAGEGQQDFPRFVKLVYRTAHAGKVATSVCRAAKTSPATTAPDTDPSPTMAATTRNTKENW